MKRHKFDFHIHSLFSYDCQNNLEDIIKAAKEKGLSGIAITDHNSFQAYDKILQYSSDDFVIIPGIEIKTNKGDIIALFLKYEIKNRDFFEVLNAIKKQDGISVYPHPYRGTKDEELVASKVQIVEVLNGKSVFIKNLKAYWLARKYKKPIIAGSDAHAVKDIGIHGIILNCNLNLESIKYELLKNNAKCFGFKKLLKINLSLIYKKIINIIKL